jgi:hypothetical protein
MRRGGVALRTTASRFGLAVVSSENVPIWSGLSERWTVIFSPLKIH